MISDWRTTVSDDRDDDVTPEPDEGSGVTDSAAGSTAEGAGDTPATSEPSDHGIEDGAGEAAVPARPSGKRRGGGGSASRPASIRKGRDEASERPGAKGRATPARSKQESPSKGNPISRIMRYLREVVAELRKVIWPTRNELITYTAVVLVFVAFMVALTSGLDLAFARGVLLVFG